MSWGFTLCAAFALVSGVGLSVGVKQIVDSDRFEQRTYDIVSSLEEARSSLRSSVSNMRAFLLTGDPASQQAYSANIDLAHNDIDQYSQMLGDYGSASRLYSDLNAVSAEMASVMAGRAEYGASVASKLSEDPRLSSLDSTMETDIGGDISRLNSQLDSHRSRRQDDYMLTELAFVLTMLFGALALGLAAFGIGREARFRRAAEARNADIRQDLLTAQAILEIADQKDPETGLLNREAFHRILEQEYAKSGKSQSALSLVLIDLDQFTQIREVKGAETCEMILRSAAAVLKDCFRGADVTCRYSDSEFAVIMPRTTLQNATVAAERARVAIERNEWPNCHITASLGAAQADPMKDRIELISRAEQAVDYARRTGRNRVTAIRAYLPLSA